MNELNHHTQKKPTKFLVNENDNAGEKVIKIYSKSTDFVVYRTKNTIRLDMDDDCNDIDELRTRHLGISEDLAQIYSRLPEELTWSEPINRQIARAITQNAEGREADAKRVLAHVNKRVIILRIVKGRVQYIFSSYAVSGVVLLLMVILSFMSVKDNELLQTYYFYSRIAFCGALGGMISITLSFPKLEIDIDANWITNCLVGASRVVVSVAAAIFSYFAVVSGVAFSFLANTDQLIGLYLVAMIAGFSEMLVPNIMKNLSNKEGE